MTMMFDDDDLRDLNRRGAKVSHDAPVKKPTPAPTPRVENAKEAVQAANESAKSASQASRSVLQMSEYMKYRDAEIREILKTVVNQGRKQPFDVDLIRDDKGRLAKLRFSFGE